MIILISNSIDNGACSNIHLSNNYKTITLILINRKQTQEL